MTDPSSPPTPLCRTLAVVGVGLLGGSVALGAKARGLAERVIGLGRSAARLQAARAAGVIDEFVTEPAGLAGADLVVVCTPVDRIASDVIAAAQYVGRASVITDVGSIKGTIVRAVATTPAAAVYVPAHPLAGSEQAGWEAATATLFEQRLCVLTPTPAADRSKVDLVRSLWQRLGMRTLQAGPDEHDRLLAVTSHLPHVAAAALAQLVGPAEQPFAATGFRDTTRIASGDPAIWTPILLGNSGPLLRALDMLQGELASLRRAVETHDAAAVTQWLTAARERREALQG